MTIGLILGAIMASGTPAPQTVFTCRADAKRIAVTLSGDRLTYSFGPPGRPEISLKGGPQGGVFYHRTMYNRGEDQTLRFVSGQWNYVLFNRWQAPQQLSSERIEPEYNVSGVLVMRDGKLVRRIDCNKGSGNLTEWPIFKQLKQDEENVTPDDA
ncbi:hypothetical protein [Sphingomonas asaccharolytica]|uniref:hypothetical protein n=1 Tax=Sphingomonas asaccharolytica TaxID=40681 RepID=UPI00082C1246|nr:hypothetical protein [Sphingomonas asaccharolytica]